MFWLPHWNRDGLWRPRNTAVVGYRLGQPANENDYGVANDQEVNRVFPPFFDVVPNISLNLFESSVRGSRLSSQTVDTRYDVFTAETKSVEPTSCDCLLNSIYSSSDFSNTIELLPLR